MCVLGHDIKCPYYSGSGFKKSEICGMSRPFRLRQGGWAGERETEVLANKTDDLPSLPLQVLEKEIA